MKSLFITTFLVSVCVCAALANQDETNSQNDEMRVITVTGYTQDVKSTPASISVVSSEEILEKPVRNLGDIVEEIPGITTTDEKTGTKGIQVRGFTKNYTLLLIDGKKINMDPGFDGNGFDATGGFIPPISLIERVEVVKGPAGGKYGSEAIGGVVNVITKTPKTTTGSVMLETKLQEHNDRWGNMYGTNAFVAHPFNDSVSFILNAKYQKGEQNSLTSDIVPGYTPRNAYNPYFGHAAGGYLNYGVGGRLNFKIGDNNNFYIDQNYNYQRLSTLNTSSSSITAVREYRKSNTVLNHDGEYSFGKVNNYIQYSNTRRYQHDTNDARIDSNGKPHYLNAIGASKGEVQHDRLIEDQIITAGQTWTIDYEFNKDTSAIFNFGPYISWEKLYNRANRDQVNNVNGKKITPQDAYQISLFGESEIFWNDLISTTFGLRANFVETYGDFYNPRAYVNIYPTDWLTIKGGVSSGLKVPTLSQRLEDGIVSETSSRGSDTIQYGNSNLEPEKSWNYEIGAIIDTDIAYFSLTGFYTKFSDKIENRSYDPGDTLPFGYGTCGASGTGTCSVYENVAKADMRGFEVEAKIRPFLSEVIPGGLGLDLSYGYTDTEQKSGENKGAPLSTIPQQKLTAKLWHKYGNYSSFLRYIGNYRINTSTTNHAVSSGIGEYYKDTNIVDLGINYKFPSSGITIGAVVNNLLDENFEDYELVSPTSVQNRYQKAVSGRNYWLTLRADF